MSAFDDDLHAAIAGVLSSHGLGMLGRAVVVAEVHDDDGELGLITQPLPDTMPIWDRTGLLGYASLDLAGQVTAARVVEVEADDEEEE
ncbi:hypothetical protein E6W39_29200 [Kitasatospora acidiphila]|uniref:Uncharacterized protein n=1 Tax=Kitasatospora acidiphila TaxID=2567942 RepID=A0A540W995_9ACTN|nr:hypothetical protein [Kitasatospora acidiphila]TQF05562.1 hypothetical protein E6W39_29200 [Kitasatospora acidiphila]